MRPALRQLSRERFGHVEYRSDLSLVPRQHDAFRQRFADQDQPLRRQALQVDRAAGRNLVVLFGRELDGGGFLLAAHGSA